MGIGLGFARRTIGLPLTVLRPGAAPLVLLLVDLEHHVRVQGLLDLGIEFGRRELQEAYRLLQLRRHHQALSQA